MNFPIEVDRIVELPRGHSVRAFHGAGWVVTAPWGQTDATLRVSGPGQDSRDVELFGLLSVDVSGAGDVVILEDDPTANAPDYTAARIRFVPRDGTPSSLSAQVIPSLRFDDE